MGTEFDRNTRRIGWFVTICVGTKAFFRFVQKPKISLIDQLFAALRRSASCVSIIHPEKRRLHPLRTPTALKGKSPRTVRRVPSRRLGYWLSHKESIENAGAKFLTFRRKKIVSIDTVLLNDCFQAPPENFFDYTRSFNNQSSTCRCGIFLNAPSWLIKTVPSAWAWAAIIMSSGVSINPWFWTLARNVP